MSSAEEFFGSSESAEEWGVSAFADEQTDLMAELWTEEDTARKDLLAQVRQRLQGIRRDFTMGDQHNWQSFHRTVDPEGVDNIWIVNRVGLGDEQLTRIVQCWEGYGRLRYSEFVVSSQYEATNSVRGEAQKDPEAPIWGTDNLGKCALIQFQNQQVKLFRGSENYMLYPTRRVSDDRTEAGRMDASVLIRQDLTEASDLLGRLASGVFYEPGVEGKLY